MFDHKQEVKMKRPIIGMFLIALGFIISCASMSYVRLEGNDFKENLPGHWEGWWDSSGKRGDVRIAIKEVDGNVVHLTGYMTGSATCPDADEVWGRIKNSRLILKWANIMGEDVYTMNRDSSNNLTLEGYFDVGYQIGNIKLAKIE